MNNNKPIKLNLSNIFTQALEEVCMEEHRKTMPHPLDSLGLKRSERTSGMSNLLDCSFWETDYSSVFITDYNIITDTDLRPNDLFMIFMLGCGSKLLSKLFIEAQNEGSMKLMIDDFYVRCRKSKEQTSNHSIGFRYNRDELNKLDEKIAGFPIVSPWEERELKSLLN